MRARDLRPISRRQAEAGTAVVREELSQARRAHAEALQDARDEARREWRKRVATLQGELSSEMASLSSLAALPPPAHTPQPLALQLAPPLSPRSPPARGVPSPD